MQTDDSFSGNLDDMTLVIASHGSNAAPTLNDSAFKLSKRVSESIEFLRVTPAFLQGQPSVFDVLQDITTDVLVLPWMTSQGYYSDVVFRREFEKQRRANQQIHHLNVIGIRPEIAELVHQRVLEILVSFELDSSKTRVVVVGHGTRRNKTSCRTTIDLTHSLRRLEKIRNELNHDSNRDLSFEFSFIDQRPELKHVADREMQNTIVIPFLMGLGPHATIDVPQAFGFKVDGFDSADFPRILNTGSKQVIVSSPVGTYPELAEVAEQMCTEFQAAETSPSKELSV